MLLNDLPRIIQFCQIDAGMIPDGKPRHPKLVFHRYDRRTIMRASLHLPLISAKRYRIRKAFAAIMGYDHRNIPHRSRQKITIRQRNASSFLSGDSDATALTSRWINKNRLSKFIPSESPRKINRDRKSVV